MNDDSKSNLPSPGTLCLCSGAFIYERLAGRLTRRTIPELRIVEIVRRQLGSRQRAFAGNRDGGAFKNGRIRTLILRLRHYAFAFTLGVNVAASADLDFEHHFEAGFDLNCSGNCPFVSNTFAREGAFSMRAYVDCMASQNSHRAEAVIPGAAKKMMFERDYWYGFSVFLPEDWRVTGNKELIAQFHSSPDPEDAKLGPPVAIRVGKGGAWEILSRAEGFDRDSGSMLWTLNDVHEDAGRWSDWVVHFKPSYEASGVMRIWKDSELVAERYGKNTYKDQIGPYFKMGIYAPDWKDRACGDPATHQKTVYLDSLRIASGLEAGYYDVAPPIEDVDSVRGIEGSVRIANLSAKQRVAGKIVVRVEAYDPDGIEMMVLRTDDGHISRIIGKKTEPPWNFTLDTSEYTGAERLRMKVIMHDALGKKNYDVIRVRLAEG